MCAATPPLHVVILAAGKGVRLNSALAKVMHPLFEKPLLAHVLDSLLALSPQSVQVVVGHQREAVQAFLSDYAQKRAPGYAISTAVQEAQLGTGHALMQAAAAPDAPRGGCALILSGDVPLIRPQTLTALLAQHQSEGNHLTLLSADLPEPTGYGRVLRQDRRVTRIVEEKDASEAERALTRVNAGVYAMDWAACAPLLEKLSAQNAQGEFYLTDLVALANAADLQTGDCTLQDPEEMLGVNSRADLAACYRALRTRTATHWMREGVTIIDPATTLIGPDVTIGADTTLYPGACLMGDVVIGSQCEIGPYTTLGGRVRVGDRARVIASIARDAEIGADTSVGPFAHLRDGVRLSDRVRVGNFVEVKNTVIGPDSNAAHLCYLGDARMGANVNMGAGAITANYDPIRDEKHLTVLEDGVKVGCNAVLVAPVTLGERATVAAGSVITHDVAAGDLAIARSRQSVIAGWVARVQSQQAGQTSASGV
ncbi:MAG: bifunctional UDP-N-acetylglucosamine diphosphorylase/glucosamine-1-phosphate N-acetyltransferase GlmU [Vampirovibrionales bacterium]|nr:bifunctional UDP-N-acetylglucosamine diphosphorylase/glucosamine-1-phosphate N-acetyltransferase GlmU [Vampirovibrionales bacterium]